MRHEKPRIGRGEVFWVCHREIYHVVAMRQEEVSLLEEDSLCTPFDKKELIDKEYIQITCGKLSLFHPIAHLVLQTCKKR